MNGEQHPVVRDPRIPAEVSWSTHDDATTVLVNARTGRVFQLNQTGTFFWIAIWSGHKDVEQATQIVASFFDRDPDQLREDFRRLAAELADAGMVVW